MLRRPVTALLQARLARPIAPPQSQPFDLCIRTFSHAPRRLDQPAPTRRPGRPKGVVGEPSRPVKRSVKRNAQKPASTGEDAAADKTASRKKTAAKKKAAPKKPRKELTEAQRAAKKKQLQSAKVTELKKAALKPPKVTGSSAYLEFCKEHMKGIGDQMKGKPTAEIRSILGQSAKERSQEYKNLGTAEVEHYNHLAHTRIEAQRAEFKRWVESHTPEEIAIANTARASLRRQENRKKGTKSKFPVIHDERAVKRGISAYLQFNVNRNASGDFKHIPMVERSKLISQEWKALSEDEKKKYQNLAEGEKERYQEEYTSVYGHAPGYASSVESANAVSVSA